MTFESLSKKLLENKKFNYSEWPETISVPSESDSGFFGLGKQNVFWERIKRLRDNTISGAKNFNQEHEGSTGWEYEFMMVFVYNRFFYSDIRTDKNYWSISSSHEFKIVPELIDNKIIDNIFLNNKTKGQIIWNGEVEIKKRQELRSTNKFLRGFICHFHSHPQVKINDNLNSGSFFSTYDFIAFLHPSGSEMMGVVLDRVLLACRTPESQLPKQEDIAKLNHLFSTNKEYKEELKEFSQKYKIVFYEAKFNKSFNRV